MIYLIYYHCTCGQDFRRSYSDMEQKYRKGVHPKRACPKCGAKAVPETAEPLK